MKLSPDFTSLWNVADLMGDQTFAFNIDYQPTDIAPIKIRLKEGIEVEVSDIDWDGPVASYQGHQILFYIADQGWNIDDVINNPIEGKKFHMSWCSTLDNMKRQGRIERYVATADLTGRFKVFGTSESEGGKERHARANLKVCKNCLANINYKNYHRNKTEVFREFDIPEFFEHYRSYFEHTPNLEVDPTKGYSEDWHKISARKKEQAGWRCEDCGVELVSNHDLMQTHHINGVKSDNREQNLQALCVECHSKKPGHEHMRVPLITRQRLAKLRHQEVISKLGA